jgi:ribosomal-protein-alanine N-acetyltransferase
MSDLSRTEPADHRHGPLRIELWSGDDVEDLGAYWERNRTHLMPTQPQRDESFWTVEGQRQRLERAAPDVSAGRVFPFLVREDGALVAEVTLSDVTHGAFCSSHVGYSVDGERLRRGIASWSVDAVAGMAFTELRLHRLQAATMVDNIASQRVLQRCSFDRIGVAARYLAIAGRWADHVLWQRINAEPAPLSPL